MTEILGGSHDEVRESNKKLNKEHKKLNKEHKKSHGNHKYESHHVWPYGSYKDVSQFKLSCGQGPAIRMEKEDHRLTKSHGNNPGFEKFQKQQRELLEKGNYREAWNNCIQDIRNACKKNEKPENTYDQHIQQAEKHLLKLHEQGKIKLDDKFKKELEQRQPKVEKTQAKTPTTQNTQQSQQTQKPVFSNNQNLFNQQKGKGRGH